MKLEYKSNPVSLTINGKQIENGDERLALHDVGLKDNKSILSDLPPLTHDKNHADSDVLSFIGWCCFNRAGMPIETADEALRVFNVARSKNCRWIVYDPNLGHWIGSNHASPIVYFSRLLSDTNRRIDRLNKDLASLKFKLGLK